MEFTQIRSGIFTTTVPDGAAATVTLVVGKDRCLLVDTGSTPEIGQQIREAIRTATTVPLSTVVITHGHWDHLGGLGAFTDLDTVGAERLSLDAGCRENLEWASQLDIAQVPLPATSLAAIGVRDLGGVTVEIASLGPAHTRSDLILAIPERRVLIAGDLVEEGPPQFDETTSLDGWVRTLDAMYSMLGDTTCIIPGHGAPLGPGDMLRFRAGLAGIWDQAQWAFRANVPEDEVYTFDTMEWPWDEKTARAGIAVAYRELGGPSMAR